MIKINCILVIILFLTSGCLSSDTNDSEENGIGEIILTTGHGVRSDVRPFGCMPDATRDGGDVVRPRVACGRVGGCGWVGWFIF